MLNSTLVSATMQSLRGPEEMDQRDIAALDLGVRPLLEKNIEFLNDCLDDLMHEQQRVSNYFRQIDRQRQFIATWQAKRRMENAARKAAGEELLSEEVDPAMLKPIPEPNQLDRMLITNQLKTYCAQLGSLGTQALQKISLAQGTL